MSVELIPIQGIWGFILRKLPDFLTRWYFTPTRLANLIYVDLRPRHDPAVIDLGQSASFALYLQVINLSPFEVELDRGSFRLWGGGTPLNASTLQRKIIAPGEIASLYIHEVIPDGHATQLAKLGSDRAVALDGNIEFNCKVRSFSKDVGLLEGISPKIYNAQVRSTAA
jgi:hypothetical protein